MYHVGQRAEARRAARRANVLRQWRTLLAWYEARGETLNPNTCISISERSDTDVIEALLTIASAVDPRKVGEP